MQIIQSAYGNLVIKQADEAQDPTKPPLTEVML